MLPIYPASIIREWDLFTIKNEPFESLELMERAAAGCVTWIVKNRSNKCPVHIVCGNGNNGGDGLAIARLLVHYNYSVHVYINFKDEKSSDNSYNFEKLKNAGNVDIFDLEKNNNFTFQKNSILIDCIFGSGINRKVTGYWKTIIEKLNNLGCRIISIDLPSGLPTEPEFDKILKNQAVIKATTTLTFQSPKLSMLLPGWGDYCGHVEIIDIGLSSDFITQNPTQHEFITLNDIKGKFRKREKFSHKGTHGHALVIAGNTGKCGAAILSSKACIKSGAGLVSVYSNPDCSVSINATIPEVMLAKQTSENMDLSPYSAIGIGPGIGTDKEHLEFLKNILDHAACPLLLDADALTLLAQNRKNLKIPLNTIITPHPKEFDRLVGISQNAYERLQKAQLFSKENQCIVVLKGAYTAICNPDNTIYFNSTGNPGMATAGSGDALTGIITSFLAQGYSALDAAIIGVFVHGKSGDAAVQKKSMTGLIASDIIDNLDEVFKVLEQD